MAVRCRAHDTSNGTYKNWQQESILHMQFVSNNVQPVIIRKLIRHRANFTHNNKLTFSVFKALARRKTHIFIAPALNVAPTESLTQLILFNCCSVNPDSIASSIMNLSFFLKACLTYFGVCII